jgi:hypothetical protein
MDGAACGNNNPLNLLDAEFPIAWPGLDKPHRVLSLGTGMIRKSSTESPVRARSIWKSGFPIRIIECYLGIMEDERQPKNGLRININVDGNLPELDDVSQMQRLIDIANQDETIEDSLDNEAALLVASLLCFVPSSAAGSPKRCCVVHGKVQCRLDLSPYAQRMLLSRLTLSTFVCGEDISKRGKVFPVKANWGKEIRVEVPHGSKEVSIGLRMEDGVTRHISGSPFLLDQFRPPQGHFRKRSDAHLRPSKRLSTANQSSASQKRVKVM